MDDLRAHPTVKPIAMIADAIKDCTQRNQLVLDTLAAPAQRCLQPNVSAGRRARFEIDPRYIDVAIRRWQAFTGSDAVHVDSGRTFEEMMNGRSDRTPARSTRRVRR